MRRKARLVGVLSTILLGLAMPLRAAGTGDEAAEAFNALYAGDLKRVKATREAEDDIELATRLLAAARKVTGQPALVTVLCEQAADLAGAAAAGIPTAIGAMELLAATVPEKAAACAERVVAIRQMQFDGSQGDERAQAADALIGALLAAADAKVQSGALLEAAVLLVRARNAARAVSSPREAELDARARTLTQQIAADLRIKELKALLEKDPQNAGAREGLVRVYLVDLDDPAEAAKHLEGVKDPALLKYVPAAAKGVEAPPELACLELGEWYHDLAAKAPFAARPAMYARAKAYLKRFLKLHRPKDLNRSRATLALEKIEQTAAKLAAATDAISPSRPATSGKGAWIDLLALVDPAKDKVEGTWQRLPGGLAVVQKLRRSRITIPVAPEGSYELQLRFVRTEGGDAISTVLPVGSTKVVLFLSTYAGKAHGLSDIRRAHAISNETTVEPGTIENGQDHSLEVRVELEDDQARIRVGLDARSIIDWKGEQSALAPIAGWDVPQAGCLSVGANGAIMTWQIMRLRMLSGEARLLRPAAR